MRLTLITLALAGCSSQGLLAASDGAVTDGSSRDLAVADLATKKGAPTNHRADDSACGGAPAPGDCSFGGGGGPGECGADSACTAGVNGRCVESTGGALFCSCSYDTCQHDSDCKTGQLCACHGSAFSSGKGNTCVDGNCRVDSDCGAGGYCSPAHGTSGCGGLTGYYCHTASDSCVNDEDCANSSGLQVCTWSATDARWECQQELLCA